MKKIISSMLLVTFGALTGFAAPISVKNLDGISNEKVYLLRRQIGGGTSGYLYLKDTTEGAQLFSASASKTKADTTSTMAQYSIHYSESEKAYFLYHLGSEKFVSGNENHEAIITEAASELIPLVNEKAADSWIFLTGGYTLGTNKTHGYALFFDDMNSTQSRIHGVMTNVYLKSDKTLSKEEIDAIEQKVAAGRNSKLEFYRDFLKTKILSSGDLANYIGGYDMEELQYALDNDSKFTLKEIEEIYQRTLMSRYPTDDGVYRIRNTKRPNNNRRNNLLCTKADGGVYSRNLTTSSFGTATDGYTDDLCLFTMHSVDGDPTKVRIKAAAMNQYLSGGGNLNHVSLTSSADEASQFNIEFIYRKEKKLNFIHTTRGSRLSVTSAPECRLWGYNVIEDVNEWFVEPVKSITIPVDANGYGTFCVPCGVMAPEGSKLYTVTSVEGNKLHIDEINVVVQAYTPCIIKTEAGAKNVELTVMPNTRDCISVMTGNVRVTESTPGRYVPTFTANGISFTYAAAEDNASMPGSIYLVSEDKGPMEVVMGVHPDAGIENISADEVSEDAELYDMLGRRVISTPRRGFYIDAKTRKSVYVK